MAPYDATDLSSPPPPPRPPPWGGINRTAWLVMPEAIDRPPPPPAKIGILSTTSLITDKLSPSSYAVDVTNVRTDESSCMENISTLFKIHEWATSSYVGSVLKKSCQNVAMVNKGRGEIWGLPHDFTPLEGGPFPPATQKPATFCLLCM